MLRSLFWYCYCGCIHYCDAEFAAIVVSAFAIVALRLLLLYCVHYFGSLLRSLFWEFAAIVVSVFAIVAFSSVS